MTSVYFIRHGSYIHDRVDDHGPRIDLGLSSDGRAQAQALKARLSTSKEIRPDVFLSSTERRALETAAVLADALGQPVIPDRDLEEWRNEDGTIEADAFVAQWRALTERERPFHRFAASCETGIEFTTRVHTALNRILAQNVGRTVVLMTHGGRHRGRVSVLHGERLRFIGRTPPSATSITHWRQEANTETWVLESSNDTRHLPHHVV